MTKIYKHVLKYRDKYKQKKSAIYWQRLAYKTESRVHTMHGNTQNWSLEHWW